MARKKADEPTLRDGNVIIDEQMNRREGLVEYEGSDGGTRTRENEPVVTRDEETIETPAMQAGATVLPTTDETVRVEETTTVRRSPAAGTTGDLDLSTDNTGDLGPISMVREGMKVFDGSGDEIGKVDLVRMGDPSAATTSDNRATGSGDVLTDLGAAVFGTDTTLPEPVADRLIRSGFVRVDGKGWIDTDRFVHAEEIATVTNDTVTLNVPKERLIDAG